MSDRKIIYLDDAIDALKKEQAHYAHEDGAEIFYEYRHAIKALKNLPSAQPERLTDDDFETIRIHLNAYKEKLCNQQRWEEAEKYQRIIDRLMAFAITQPEIIRCKDCKYYKDFSCTNDYWYTECLTGDLIGIDVQPWEEFYCYFAERREK